MMMNVNKIKISALASLELARLATIDKPGDNNVMKCVVLLCPIPIVPCNSNNALLPWKCCRGTEYGKGRKSGEDEATNNVSTSRFVLLQIVLVLDT